MQLALPRLNRTLLASTSALISAAALLFLTQPAQAAFDPNADVSTAGATSTIHNSRLPDTGILSGDMPSRPLYAPGSAPAPLSVAPYVSPLEPIKMPRPLYPSRAGATPQPVMMPVEIRPTTVVASPAPAAPVAPAIAAAPAPIAPAPVMAAMPVDIALEPIALTPAPAAPAVAAAPPIVAPAPVVVAPKMIAAAPAPAMVAAPAMPNLPPVDEATAARAQVTMQAEQKPAVIAKPIMTAAPAKVAPPMQLAAMAEPVASTTPGALPGTFIAPAPVLARAPVAAPAAVSMAPAKPAMVAAPAPIMVPARLPTPAPMAKPTVMAAPAPMVVAAPAPAPMAMAAKQPVDDISPIVQPDLSSQSREMLSHVPSRIDSPVAGKTARVKLERVSPQIQQVLGKSLEEENYESTGISIKVRRPGLDTNYELNSAYNSLMGGDTQRAIQTYKNIIGTEPRNEDALFGLAATYHRLGMESQARPYYAALLKINPNHREALNNFLVLVSNESPADALPELERLELRNPDFSPIPAQIAIVYDRLGYPNQARDKMIRAIDLAPENLTYKYNLAIMLDRHKQYADAVALYRVLIQAALNGERVPASVEAMEKRLNYITTAATEGRLGS